MNIPEACVTLYRSLSKSVRDAGHIALTTEFEQSINVANGALLFELYTGYLLPLHPYIFDTKRANLTFQQRVIELWEQRSKTSNRVSAFVEKNNGHFKALLHNAGFMKRLEEMLLVLYDVYCSVGGNLQ